MAQALTLRDTCRVSDYEAILAQDNGMFFAPTRAPSRMPPRELNGKSIREHTSSSGYNTEQNAESGWKPSEDFEANISRLEQVCDSYERKLLRRVVDTKNIAADYADIYLDPSIIDRIERAAALSLERSEAFSHGILGKSKFPGVLLYGPPGTGKSTLAKSLAKHAGFRLLRISRADFPQTHPGEVERGIHAIFSLAHKLAPCIIFVHKADAIFGRKGCDGTQFLLEWDGIPNNSSAPFILLTTSRPFDLDSAVLDRAFEHIHIGIPSTLARAHIIRIHVSEEDLASDVSILALASSTCSFTGSDLKKLCVNAAMECISEQQPDSDTGMYPSERTLHRWHFVKALQSTKPSILRSKMRSRLRYFSINTAPTTSWFETLDHPDYNGVPSPSCLKGREKQIRRYPSTPRSLSPSPVRIPNTPRVEFLLPSLVVCFHLIFFSLLASPLLSRASPLPCL
ncbi:unnamed protein product [Tuber aestivum]|uniref:AAA+ ATPase domain-containing protein n=1 Tax=Tuber aestivum TaxID=59557 RepID=A0A292PI46_9PEZI|nr:unnamed protein product [Tuber aestivum]